MRPLRVFEAFDEIMGGDEVVEMAFEMANKVVFERSAISEQPQTRRSPQTNPPQVALLPVLRRASAAGRVRKAGFGPRVRSSAAERVSLIEDGAKD
jgi:hypothetical protein